MKNKSTELENFAYVDFEFTCSNKMKEFQDRKHINEIMSVGIGISQKGKLIDTFYETVKPIYNPKLTSFCKELTRLTQEEIDKSRGVVEVLCDAFDFVEKYKVNSLIVFGNQDRENLKREIYWHKKEVDKEVLKKLNKFASKIQNKQSQICQRILKETIIISLNDCKQLLNIPGEIQHNALSDAIDLSKVDYQSLHKTISEKSRREYLEKRKEEIRYKQLRRVKDESIICKTNEDKEIREEIKNVVNYLKEKNSEGDIMEPIKMNAIIDDLLFLVREEDEE